MRCRPLLGTFVEIDADRPDAIEAGFAAIERIHALMSAHEAGSELSRLNRSTPAAPVHLSSDTSAVLARARFWFEASDGVFDPVRAGAFAVAQRALPLHPDQPPSDPNGDFSALILDGETAYLSRPATIDLGGIAKGHAVDVAIAAMRAAGARHGIVNAGGDLAAFGAPQDVAIRDPDTGAMRISVTIDGRALATSAAHPGPDGTAHLPAGARYRSVTVEAARAIDADALTKIVWAGHARLADLLALADARAVALGADGAILEPVSLT